MAQIPDPLTKAIRVEDGVSALAQADDAPASAIVQREDSVVQTTPSLPLSKSASPPDERPPEIEALFFAQNANMPITVIVTSSSSTAAYVLPGECGCAFLGLFCVRNVHVSSVSRLCLRFMP